jgi:hypothetical protein
MNNQLTIIQKRIKSLIQALPEEIDRSWLASSYLSLKKAQTLQYKDDAFSKLPKATQDQFLLTATSLSIQKKVRNSKQWIAGYYFNNALFRTVALAEIGLKVLYTKETKNKPPKGRDVYYQLKDWYTAKYNMNLTTITKARKQVNEFKHDTRGSTTIKRFETMNDAIVALNEVLTLLEKV